MHRSAAALLVTLLVATGIARGDTTGALNGTVSDNATGAPLANATIVVNSPQEREETKTDQQGRYAFLDLQPGLYTLSAMRLGYEPYAARVAVRPGSEVTLKIGLFRILKTVVVDRFWRLPLVQPGVVADLYRVRRWNAPAFELGDSAFPLIFAVPGITFGSAARTMR